MRLSTILLVAGGAMFAAKYLAIKTLQDPNTTITDVSWYPKFLQDNPNTDLIVLAAGAVARIGGR